MKKVIIVLLIIIIVLTTITLAFMTRVPSHQRKWEVGHEKLPHIQISGDDIIIKNMRDFTWDVDGNADGNYIIDKFKFSEIDSLDVIVSHFSDSEAIAHIFISFGFENGKHIVISVETRRENHEKFSVLQGLMNKFELIYVVGTEKDIIGTRTSVRGERVYLYSADTEPEVMQKLFKLIAHDVNMIYGAPRFYNTLSLNCTNAITRRAEEVADIDFPFTYKMLLPGFVDEILYDMSIIKKNGTFEQTQERAEINNDRIELSGENFSEQIRTNFKEVIYE